MSSLTAMVSVRKAPVISALLALMLACSPATRADYAPDHPEYPRLTSRALGMGGAVTAWIDDSSSILHNPAGLGQIRTLSISHSHSRNHFPGAEANLDQLDCDPTSFIVPLDGAFFGWPIGSAGTGWTLHGELGYDYRDRNLETIPRERLFGMGPGDRYQGAGFHLWPGGLWGFAHRTSEYVFTSGAELPDEVTWRRTGEGGVVGVQQTVVPGLQYGAVFEQMDYDYLPLRDNITGERVKSTRTGWAIRPTAWLLVARDVETSRRTSWFSIPEGVSVEDTETSETVRLDWGVEIKLGSWFAVRWGSYDGHPTSGWSYNICPLRSDSAWVEGFMPEMVEGYPDSPAGIQDFHTTGFNLGD